MVQPWKEPSSSDVLVAARFYCECSTHRIASQRAHRCHTISIQTRMGCTFDFDFDVKHTEQSAISMVDDVLHMMLMLSNALVVRAKRDKISLTHGLQSSVVLVVFRVFVIGLKSSVTMQRFRIRQHLDHGEESESTVHTRRPRSSQGKAAHASPWSESLCRPAEEHISSHQWERPAGTITYVADYADRKGICHARMKYRMQRLDGAQTVALKGLLCSLIPDYYCYLSDSMQQDARTTCANTEEIIRNIRWLDPTKLIAFTSLLYEQMDGCSKQYRCGTALFLMS